MSKLETSSPRVIVPITWNFKIYWRECHFIRSILVPGINFFKNIYTGKTIIYLTILKIILNFSLKLLSFPTILNHPLTHFSSDFSKPNIYGYVIEPSNHFLVVYFIQIWVFGLWFAFLVVYSFYPISNQNHIFNVFLMKLIGPLYSMLKTDRNGPIIC